MRSAACVSLSSVAQVADSGTRRKASPRCRKAGAFAGLAVAATALTASLLFSQTAYGIELSSTSGEAADNYGITWTIDNTGVLKVTVPDEQTYTGDSTITIPGVMDGITVTRIQGSNSAANAKVTKLEYPKTITNMSHNQAASLPCDLGSVEEIAFHGEGDFSLTSIGHSNPQQASKPIFPSTLKKFNAGEVDGVQYDVVLPSSLTTVRPTCFKGTSVTSLYIPSSVTQFGSSSFGSCLQLETVTNASNVWAAFASCPNITTYNVIGSPTEIASGAFSGWTKLETVEIPEGITSIGQGAFKNCTSLESITMNGEELLTIGNYAFQGATSLKTLTIPDSVTDIGYGAFFNSGIEALVLPASLWEGFNYSQSAGTAQDFIVAPEVFTFDQGATARSAALFVPEPNQVHDSGVQTSGVRALVDKDLWNNTIGAIDLSRYDREFIPHYMFSGCASLSEIEIPSSVDSLGYGVFTDCVSLKKAYFYNLNGASLVDTLKDAGSTGTGYEGWTNVYPGTFSKHSNPSSGASLDKTAPFDEYTDLDSLTIYGVASASNLAEYAANHDNYTFVPFAFLGDGGSSEDAVAKFGETIPANGISIASFTAGGSPSIEIIYPYDEGVSRTLVPDEDCTVVYTDANGNKVTSFEKAGTYTATITGDNKSVWGTTTAQFTVAAAPTVDVPVADSGNTGITAEGSLVVPDGSETILEVVPVTEGEAYDALIAKLGDDTLAGMFEAKLLVDGQEVHDGFGSITLTFPLDAKWNGHYVTVYHRHDDGTITSERVVAADGKVSVTVTDLSTFMLAASDVLAVTPPTQTDQTQPTQQASGQGDGSALNSLADTGDSVPVIPIVAAAGAAVVVAGAAAFAQSRRQ